METELIYVQLLDEGTRVYRPVRAERLPGDLLRLIAPADYDPQTERWEFPPGAVVRMRVLDLHSGAVPVASERIG